MGRHTKATVDYFPHYVHHGKTLHIIQNLYGNDGYAFFYKLLEVLGDAEGHYYDCRDETSKEFLAAQTNVEWITGAEILNKLSSMRVIDADLWQIGVIWMDSFVESVKDAYRKRSISVPVKPQVSVFLPPEMQDRGISTAGSTQSKVKKTKVKKSKEENIGGIPENGKPPDPDVKNFIDYAFQTFENVFHEKMLVDGKKDGALVKKLLSTYGIDRLKGLWDVFMRSNDPFICQAGRSIGVFKTQINKLVSGGFNGTGNNGRGSAGQPGTQAQGAGRQSEYPVDVEETIGDY